MRENLAFDYKLRWPYFGTPSQPSLYNVCEHLYHSLKIGKLQFVEQNHCFKLTSSIAAPKVDIF